MDVERGSDIAASFVTNVGLITTFGVHGHNIMACEWTHQISYRPGLISISVERRHASHDNILLSKEFGVNIASAGQKVTASVAGKMSGKLYDKIGILEELGTEFYPAAKIKALLVKESVANLECKLIGDHSFGSHTVFIGQVLEGTYNRGKEPLAYHKGRYWALDAPLEKPADEVREKIRMLYGAHKKN